MSPSRKVASHRLAAVWFADIVGYSRIASENERDAFRLAQALQVSTREATKCYGGRVVKFIGDAALAEFSGTEEAVRAADGLRRLFDDRARQIRRDSARLRIGIHVGDVTTGEDGDLYGDGVNVAARIQAEAEPGQIVVSEDVCKQLRRRPGCSFVPIGTRELRGIAEPVALFDASVDKDTEDVAAPAAKVRFPALRSARPLGVIAVMLLVAVAAIAVWRRTSSLSPADAVESIAVLPFKDMSPGRDQEYFSDGVSEEILNALAQVPGLKVAGRTSSFLFKDRDADVREIGKQLGVEAVLEGSVRKSGDRLRITVQLLSTQDGFHLWSQTYDREPSDVIAVQEEIARSVAEALRMRLPGKALVPGGTLDVEAYDLYLRGRSALRSRTREDMEQALQYFRAAIGRDGDFAGPHTGLADAYTLLVEYRFGPSEELLPLARQAAERAITLNERLAEAHASLGLIDLKEKHWEASARHLRRAIELNPGYVPAHQWLGVGQMMRGDLEDALREFHLAVQLDPLAPSARTGYTQALLFSGDYAAARAQAQRMTEIAPNRWQGWMMLSKVLEFEGRPREAVDAARKAVEVAPDQPIARAQLATAYVKTGDVAKAREILAELEASASCPYCIAKVYAALGDRERAFPWLNRAVEDPGGGFFPKVDPTYDALRADPRFEQLLNRMGLD